MCLCGAILHFSFYGVTALFSLVSFTCRSRLAPSCGFQCLYPWLRSGKLAAAPLYSVYALICFCMMESHLFAATHVPSSIENPVSLKRACIPSSYPYDCAHFHSSHADSVCALNPGDALYTRFHMMLMGHPTWMSWEPIELDSGERCIQLVPCQLNSGEHQFLTVEEAAPLIELIDSLTTIPFDQILNSEEAISQVLAQGETTLAHLPSAFKSPIAVWEIRLRGEPGQLELCRRMLGLKPMADSFVLDQSMNPENRMPTARNV